MTTLSEEAGVDQENLHANRTDLTRARARILLIAGAGLIFFVSIVLSRNMTGPVIYSDGLAYFANARFLSGTRIVPDFAPIQFYYPGYSFLIAPLYWLPIGPELVYKGVLLLNAALGSVQFLLGYFFLHRVVAVGRRVAIWSSLAAALYPGVLLLQTYEYADNLFRVVLLACGVGAGLFVQRSSLGRGVLLGALAASAYAVHPRGLGVVAATLVFLLIGIVSKKRAKPGLVGLATVIVLASGVYWLNQTLIEAIYSRGDRSVGGLLSRLLAADFWLEVPVRAAGQVWYLTVGTAGLFPVGVAVAGVAAWRGMRLLKQGKWLSSGDASKLYLIMASAALFAISVIFLTPTDATLGRLDRLIYGRYNDAFAVVFVMVAVAHLIDTWDSRGGQNRSQRTRIPGAALTVMVVSGLILGIGGAEGLASGVPFAPITVLGISVYVGAEATIPLLAASIGGVILALLVLGILPRISVWTATAFLCLAFVAISFVSEQRVLRGYNDYWMSLLTLHHSIRYIGPPAVIGYDEAHDSVYGQNGYQFWLDHSDFQLFDSDSSESPPDVDLVIASENWDKAPSFGARLIAIEPILDQGLWVLPGEVQDDMAEAGYLLATDPTGQLPSEAMASEIEVVSGLREGDVVTNLQSATVRIRVRHDGKGSPWIPLGAWDPSPTEGSVRLVARWIPIGDTDVAATQIAELPRTVLPGEEVMVDLTLLASDSGQSLEIGEYTLRIGLVQEGVGWFEEAGDPQLDIPVHVTNP